MKFTSLLFPVFLSTAVLTPAFFLIQPETNEPITHIGKTTLSAPLKFYSPKDDHSDGAERHNIRLENLRFQFLPQELPEPYVYDLVMPQKPIKDTLPEVIIDFDDVRPRPCGCAVIYEPIMITETIYDWPEEEPESLLPEPVYIDPDYFEATVYPNPTQGQSTVELDIYQSGQFSIDLYSLSGQLIQSLHSGLISEGRQRFELDLYDQPVGMYLINIRSEQQTETLKIQKL